MTRADRERRCRAALKEARDSLAWAGHHASQGDWHAAARWAETAARRAMQARAAALAPVAGEGEADG